jgi:drug/metabolite transporter (DMT)-like permease
MGTPGVTPARRRRLLVIAVSLAYILMWSTGFIAIKFGVRNAPPLTMLTMRFLLAAVFMAVIVRWLGHPWPATRRAWIRLGILGLLNLGIPAALNFIAMRRASASMASLVFVANPLMLAALAPRLLGEKITRAKILGLVIGSGGVAFVMISRLGGKDRADTPLGVALLFLAVVCMVCATLVFKRFPPREPLLMVNVVQQLVSGAVLLPAALAFEHPGEVRFNFTFIASLLHLVFVVSVLAGLLWFWLLARGEASVASSSLFLVPVLTLLYASWTLNETFTLRDCIGLVAITIGSLVVHSVSPRLLRRPAVQRGGSTTSSAASVPPPAV